MSTSRNIIALYGASVATVIAGLTSAPVYLHYLGIEAYAITGVLITLQMWFAVLDLGLSPALSRSVTQFTAGTRDADWLGSVYRGLERIFLLIAVLVAVLVAVAAPWLTEAWLDASTLPGSTVTQSLVLIGMICGLRLWQGLYVGGITGLQQLQWLSGFNAIAAVVRLGLSTVIIAWLWTDVRMLLVGNVLLSLGELLVVRQHFRAGLPASCLQQPVRWEALVEIRAYAGGLALTSVVTILLTGLDKIILPTYVSLQAFGCYMLAFGASQALYRVVMPVHSAVQPRLTELRERGDENGFAVLYHSAAQAVAVMVMPVGLVLAACPEAALWAWTGNAAIAAEAAEVLRLLAIATALHSCMYIPYAAQLAHGWTSLALRLNIVMVILLVPALLIGVRYQGIVAAAWCWLALNLVYLFVGQALMTRRILRGHMLRWYLGDLLPVSAVAALCAGFTAWVLPVGLNRIATAGLLIAAVAIATLLAGLVSPLRVQLLARLWRGRVS